ncbi:MULTISPECIES: sensor histidine kinase [Alteromonas]|jgi:signal transduction histidine kinase|uniref:histidine kinase n=1 Tax=Alteromonas stellipolaris TaxID=233316 RepID=A0AAW7YYZ2_9ALTE|nr:MULTISPECIES: ATP-binding protein [Alteromonas]AMJ89648.1 histidine kinase [Alteromonas sp. Mac2]AMJ85788.1 histidine kinase [Alteromonas sp. Mac1]AMJ93463.1 histidine kinase [Alteromonas stellipolaris]ANB19992.1 histidine kinase [Alteromonas stellipolaris]ANB26112.1 histidine kinase [Alteromonas stellipolaris]
MAAVKTGLSRKLLTRVLSVYFILTLIVTVGQIFTEYLSTKDHVEDELQTLKNTFSTSLTRALWELNSEQASSIAEGLLELPIVEGVQVRDENGNQIADFGLSIQRPRSPIEEELIEDHPGGIFSYSFPLIFKFSGRESTVGDVTLYSSFDTIFGRIEIGIFFLIGNALIKTTFLVFLFMTAFRTMLSEPLAEIIHQMEGFDPLHPDESKLSVKISDDNELLQLKESYNNVIDDLIVSNGKLTNAQSQLSHANKKLDDQNLILEQEVAKKTSSLSQIMLSLEQQKDELIANQRELRQENENRQYIEDELRKKNSELANSMGNLQLAKDQLVESERMASLGGLVAGITHDVNTPLGVGVTAASFLQERLNNLKTSFEEKSLTTKNMENFINEAEQTANLLLTNLNRASELIASFKQVAVDQTSETEREINLNDYIRDIIKSLKPSFKHNNHEIVVNCPEDLYIRCAPGAIAQIVTNMIVNSLVHGFEDTNDGKITLDVSVDNNTIEMRYRDNGKGLSNDDLDRLFDAFFTTKRGEGGSGLGTHIMYNLVTQSLSGHIEAQSKPGDGLQYTIRFPMKGKPA